MQKNGCSTIADPQHGLSFIASEQLSCEEHCSSRIQCCIVGIRHLEQCTVSLFRAEEHAWVQRQYVPTHQGTLAYKVLTSHKIVLFVFTAVRTCNYTEHSHFYFYFVVFVLAVMLTTWHPKSAKVVTNFTDKRRSLGRYSSLADSGHGEYLFWLQSWWSFE
jgi:hypothetical protein